MVHGEGIWVHRNGIEKALGALVEAMEQLLTKAAFLRRLLEQQIVVISDAELVRQRRADLAAAASVLSSNGNDHKDSSFIAKQNGTIESIAPFCFRFNPFLRCESFRSCQARAAASPASSARSASTHRRRREWRCRWRAPRRCRRSRRWTSRRRDRSRR